MLADIGPGSGVDVEMILEEGLFKETLVAILTGEGSLRIGCVLLQDVDIVTLAPPVGCQSSNLVPCGWLARWEIP